MTMKKLFPKKERDKPSTARVRYAASHSSGQRGFYTEMNSEDTAGLPAYDEAYYYARI